MTINYQVWVKAAPHSPWRFTGIVESHKPTAIKVWDQIIRSLGYHAYELRWCTYGVTIERN